MERITGHPSDLVVYLMSADKNALFDLSAHKVKRTLSQNSYYWALLGQVAQKSGISSSVIHNQNLRDLGLVLRVNDEVVPVYIPDTDEAEKIALAADEYHIKPTSQVKEGKDGKMYRCYVMLRGSKTFNTEEMTALLNLMIQEAVAQKIEVLTPRELAQMREHEKNAQKNKSYIHNAESTTGG